MHQLAGAGVNCQTELLTEAQPFGPLVLHYRSDSIAAQDIAVVPERLLSALKFVSRMLEIEPGSLPRLSIYLEDTETHDEPIEEADPGQETSERLVVCLVYDVESPGVRPELPLARALLQHALGAST